MKTTLRLPRTNKLNRKNRATGILASSAAALIAFSLSPLASAATFIKANNSTFLDTNGSWTTAGAPTGVDIAQFDNTVATAANINGIALGSNQTWGQLKIVNPAGPLVITSGFVLTLNGIAGTGIDMSGATQDFTVTASGVTLGGSQTWNVAGGRTITLQGGAPLSLVGNTLTTSGAGNVVINSVASGTGGITQSGSGNVTLAGANTYTGATSATSGTLTVGAGGTVAGSGVAISGTAVVAGAGTINTSLNYTSSSSSTFAGGITGAGSSVTLNNAAATLTLSAAAGTSTYGGGTFIQSGTLLIGATNTLPTATVVTLNNAAGTGTPLLSLVGFDQAIAGLNITAVEGSKTVVNIGAGRTLTVNGTIALTDDTTNAGNANRATIAGAGALDLGGAVRNINVAGQNNGSGPFGGDLIINTKIQNGGINYTGTNSSTQGNQATLILGGTTANTLTLASTVNSGTLILNKTAGVDAISGPSLTVGNTPAAAGTGTAIVQIAASNQINTATKVILNGDGTFDRFGNTQTLNGAGAALQITNGNVVDTVGGSTLTIGGGGLNMSGGVIGSAVGGATTVLNADVTATSTAATGAALIKDNVTLANGQRTFTVNAGTAVSPAPDLNITGIVSDGGAGFAKAGTGTMQLGGINTYTGQTIVNAGTLLANQSTVGGKSALGVGDNTAATGTQVNAAGTLMLANTVNISTEFLTLNGGQLLVAPGGTATWGGTILVSPGTTGTLDSKGGTLNVGAIIKASTGPAATTVVFTDSSNSAAGVSVINVNGVISGGTAGGTYNNDITVNGVTTTLNASNTYLGPTHISSTVTGGGVGGGNGILDANAPAALPIANGRTAVDIDQSGVGGSILNIGGTGAGPFPTGSNQAVASLVGAATSSVTLGANTLTVGFGNGLNTNGTAGAIFAGVISGTGGLTKDETSTQILTGVNTYTGATTINQGTLQINAGGNLSATGAVTVNSGGILGVNLTGGSTFNPASIVDNVGGLINANNAAGTQTISGTISGGGAFTQSGAGITVLTGPNSFTGVTNVNLGTLKIGNATALGTAAGNTVVAAGATLDLNGQANVGEPLAISGTGDAGNVQIAALTNTAAGVSNLTGTLTLNANANVGSNAGNISLDNVVSGAGLTLTKVGSDTVFLTANANSYGPTTINAGILSVGGTNAGAATAAGSLGTGLVTNNATLNFNMNTPLTVNNVITGAGAINQNGSNVTTLNGANNAYTGAITVNLGTLKIGNAAALGTAAGSTTVVAGASLDLNGQVNVAEPISIAGTGDAGNGQIAALANSAGGVANITGLLTLTANANVGGNAGNISLDGGIAGAFGLTKVGTDTVFITSNANATTSTTINAGGTLQVGGATAGGTAAGALGGGTVTNNGILTFNRNNALTVGNVINGAGAVNQNGSGITTLNGANGYTGVTTVNLGTLKLGNAAALGTAAGNTVVVAGASLDLNGQANVAEPLNIAGSGDAGNAQVAALTNSAAGVSNLTGTVTLSANASVGSNAGNISLDNTVTGVGLALAKVGTDTVFLTANGNSYGATAINGGILQIGGATVGGTATGSLGNGNVVNNATLNFNLTSSPVISNLISGTGILNQNGTGTTTLTGANTYTGATNANLGVLQIGNGVIGSISPASAVSTAAAGTLAINLANNSILTNAIANAGTVNAIQAGTNTLSGIISGAGKVTQNGTGTTILSGVNTYTGGTTLNTGILAFGNASAFGKGNLIVNGGTLQNATLGTTNVPLNVNIGNGNFVSNGGIYVAIVGGPDGGTQLHDQITTTGMVTGKNNGQFLTLTQTNGYRLNPGDQVTLVSATGGVAGGSALGTPVAPGAVGGLAAFSNSPLLVPTVNLYQTAIILEAMQGSFAGLNGFSLGNGQFLTLTPNQLSAATALDSVAKANNFKTGGPNSTNPAFLALGYIDNASAVSLRSVPGLLDRLTPDELASIFSIGTELSSLQNTNLMRHFDEFRAEGGSAASGLVNNLNSVSVSSSNPDGMEGPRGRGGKEIRAPRQYQGNERWGTFLMGSGNFSRVGSTSNAAGYDFTTGGVTVGIEYKVMENLVVGVDAGYANTSTDLTNGGKVDVNGGQFGLFASYFNSGFYVDAAGHYGVADYRTRRAGLGGLATGSPDGDSWSAFINTGYDFKVGGWTIGPTVNFQYTNTHLDRFTETGSLAPLTVSGHNGESIRTNVGFRAFYDCNVGGIILRPEVRAGWQHEYSSASEVLTSNFATLGGNAFNVNGPVVGRDALLVGTGVTMVWNTLLSTFVAYDGELARTNATSHSVSGGVRIKF